MTKPVAEIKKPKEEVIIGEEPSDESSFEEYDYFDHESYSVSGWFKWSVPDTEAAKPCHLLFRLTNNKKIEDAKLGDRTLAAFHC